MAGNPNDPDEDRRLEIAGTLKQKALLKGIDQFVEMLVGIKAKEQLPSSVSVHFFELQSNLSSELRKFKDPQTFEWKDPMSDRDMSIIKTTCYNVINQQEQKIPKDVTNIHNVFAKIVNPLLSFLGQKTIPIINPLEKFSSTVASMKQQVIPSPYEKKIVEQANNPNQDNVQDQDNVPPPYRKY